MNVLIAGFGQIGQAFRHALNREIVLILDPEKGFKPLSVPFDILLICFPYSDGFVKEVMRLQHEYTPVYTVIASTVPVGTSKQCGAYHTPVEGKHPDLRESLHRSPRWLSGHVTEELQDAFDFGSGVEVVHNTEETEMMKLLSTAVYALNIEFARYMKQCANEIGMDYSRINDFFKDYNALYQDLGLPGFQKYILDPPKGKIGGHCVLPNAEMLNKQFPNALVRYVVDINNNRKYEGE